MVWAIPISLAATDGIDFSFSSSCYLDVSVHTVSCTIPMYSVWPGSGISGSTLICQLPQAYRRLSRPSSPSNAKTSPIFPQQLDHKYPALSSKLSRVDSGLVFSSQVCLASEPANQIKTEYLLLQIQLTIFINFLNLSTCKFREEIYTALLRVVYRVVHNCKPLDMARNQA